MECPKCGTEIKEPIKTWQQRREVKVMTGLFKCPKCKVVFRQAVEKTVEYEEFIEMHPRVKEWLRRRPKNSMKTYGSALMKFCEFANVSPERFQEMDRKEARDL